QQIGTFSADGAVNNASSPAANNVNLLVQTVALNYLALHGEQGRFTDLFGTNLGNSAMLDSLTVFNQIQ
ncbi:MAG: general secretion pathway protein GspF, partial [Candidatus Thiodiazotropha sp. (ex Notomyrtea botanica)]|nr:general secretion pathway protein GspF [Candidatus Thiodiazotropha sp. (ex Notomyrtea botanica)]